MIYDGYWESDDLARAIESLHRKQDNNYDVEGFRDSLHGFRPAGVVWIFGHYLRFFVEHPNGEGIDLLWYFLVLTAGPSKRGRQNAAAFTNEMKIAVCAFIDYISNACVDFEFAQEKFSFTRQFWCGKNCPRENRR